MQGYYIILGKFNGNISSSSATLYQTKAGVSALACIIKRSRANRSIAIKFAIR